MLAPAAMSRTSGVALAMAHAIAVEEPSAAHLLAEALMRSSLRCAFAEPGCGEHEPTVEEAVEADDCTRVVASGSQYEPPAPAVAALAAGMATATAGEPESTGRSSTFGGLVSGREAAAGELRPARLTHHRTAAPAKRSRTSTGGRRIANESLHALC